MTVWSFCSMFSLVEWGDFALRILISCLCGGLIGVERTKRLKEAGIRTHLVVCCAAAMLMILSKYGFADLTDSAGNLFGGTRGADAARIAAQVVSGISFLGAGVIFKNGNTVKGLTTAAGIWATAGIGLAIGAGMVPLGVFVTGLIFLFQYLMHRFPFGADSYTSGRFRIGVGDGVAFQEAFQAEVDAKKLVVNNISVTRNDDGSAEYDVILKFPRGVTAEDFRIFLSRYEDVKHYSITPLG